MFAGSQPKKVLTGSRRKKVLVGSRTKKVLANTCRLSAKEGARRFSNNSQLKKVLTGVLAAMSVHHI
ncbi:hypothetical protein ACOSQ3_011158 [Xanthoceras sorbifolium]